VALAVLATLGGLGLGTAWLLAIAVPDATDPAAWGSPPALSAAAAVLVGAGGALGAFLLGGRLLTERNGSSEPPRERLDAIVLTAFGAIAAAATALWAFGVGIGLDDRPAWLDGLMAVAAGFAALGALVCTFLVHDRAGSTGPR